MNPLSRWLPTSLLAAACLAAAVPSTAHAGFGKIQGQYQGTYLSSVTYDAMTYNTRGPTRATIKSINVGREGRLNLAGSSDGVPGSRYTARVEFKAGGNCSTNAILPGIIETSATGHWTSSAGGKRVKYTVTSTSVSGTYTAQGTIIGTGEHLKVTIKLTGNSPLPGALKRGSYTYNGSR